jgi:site-specific DNA-cytosine methylase
VLRVKGWDEPAATVTSGSGPTNGGGAVADPRVRFGNVDRITPWAEPVHTITHSPAPSSGAAAVADPRVSSLVQGESVEDNRDPTPSRCAEKWADTTGNSSETAAGNVAKPQLDTKADCPGDASSTLDQGSSLIPESAPYDHAYGVLSFNEPSPTVAGGSMVGQGAYAVADERYRGSYGVLDWDQSSGTVTGNARTPTGRFSVADPRDISLKCAMRAGAYRVLSWRYAAATITGHARAVNGPFSVADPRKPPPVLPIIIAADGTWHRPLTTLELAVLQSFPSRVNGEPLVLDGSSSSAWRERIGNAVPPKTAQAIGTQMLVTLLAADTGAFTLNGGLDVWVEPQELHA